MKDIRIEAKDNYVEIEVHGKLTSAAYEHMIPLFEDLIIENQGKVRVLFIMRDFHGWTAGALWEDLKFDLKHFSDIERVAIVGERRWQHSMAVFCKPFTRAKVEYFQMEDLEEARGWLGAGETAKA